MKFVTSDGLGLFYERSGSGVPCLYLHGGPGYWSKSFQEHAQDLIEEKLDMIYIDQRGCGRSEHSPNHLYTLERLIDDIEELRKHLHIAEWVVMGHSFGGILATKYAIEHPDSVKGLIMVNTTLNMFDSFYHQIEKGCKILGLEKVQVDTDDLSSFMEFYYSILEQLIRQDAYNGFQYVNVDNKKNVDNIDENGLNSDPAFQQQVFSSEEFFQDFTQLTNHIMLPVLVVAGQRDDAVGPSHHQSYRFPKATINVLNGSHHPYIENKKEFKHAIMDFIEHHIY